MRTSRLAATTLALASTLLVTALAGCTVDIVDPGSSSDSASQTPSTASTPEQPSPLPSDSAVPDSAVPDSAVPDASGLNADNAADRATYLASATTTMPCTTDPLDETGVIIRVEGHCASLTITMDGGVVIADDVDTITLSGSATTVYAGRVQRLIVSSTASVVYWVGTAPEITDTGEANTLLRG